MTADFYERASRDLPNFPDAVIRLWFEHAEKEGWPPPLLAGFPVGRWADILGTRQPFAFWRTVNWNLEPLPLHLDLLEPESRKAVYKMGFAYAKGLPYHPDIPIPDSSKRIGEFLDVLRATGRLPEPPILLEFGPLFEVLDGNHRLAALSVAQVNRIPVDPQAAVWVGRVPRGGI